MTLQSYSDFLAAKVRIAERTGFDIDPGEVNPALKDHTRAIARWAVAGGRRAVFARFGLHKTATQIEILRLIGTRAAGRRLIVLPLGVRAEFMKEAARRFTGRFAVTLKFIRSAAEIDGDETIYLTNYETVRDGKLDPSLFVAVTLDEAACLRSYGSKTFQTFLPLFAGVRYRFVATATPSPNRLKELIHYAGFLDVMDTGEALARWFQRNSEKANDLTLYPHKEREFWLWVNTWAVFLQKPSDLGFSDEGYEMPPLDVRWHEVPTRLLDGSFDRDGQGVLIRDEGSNIVAAAREKRESLGARIEAVKRIVDEDPADHFIVWHDLEDERRAIEKALPAARAVHGAQDLDLREEIVGDFADGRLAILAAKPVMLGSGGNLQAHCHRAVFAGITVKFNDFIQAIHRLQRFGQPHAVRIDIVHTDQERGTIRILREKWTAHEETAETMSAILRQYGLEQLNMADEMRRAIGVTRVEAKGEGWHVANNDCVDETAAMADGSVDLVVTSIPFSNHYEYTPNYCFDAATEVLTRDGWKSFGAIGQTTELATLNPRDLGLEWQTPSAVIWERYDGPMLHFQNRNNFDLLVTPDHNLFVDRRVGNNKTGRKHREYGKVRAEAVRCDFVGRKYRMINAARSGNGNRPASIEIPQLPRGARGPERLSLGSIPTADFMELAGWYLSEGHIDDLDGPHVGRISISQTAVNEPYRQEIEALFRRIGLGVQVQDRAIVVHNKELSAMLVEHFGRLSRELGIPRWVKDLHPDLLRILRDTMMKGDGNKSGFAYTSFSHRLREDFQFIAFATGWGTAIRGDVVRIGQRQVFPEIRNAPVETPYDGMIGCATVANGTLVVRRNGVVSVSGNCDFGHTDDNDHFWAQMDHLTPELARVLHPGRMACLHVKDRINFGNVTGEGVPTVSPFHAEAIAHGLRHGFQYCGMITIVTDVVFENNGTYRLSYSEQLKDGTKMGVGSPEYVLLFRKRQSDLSRGYADRPVKKSADEYSLARWQLDAHAFWRSSGDRLLTVDELAALPQNVLVKAFTDRSLRAVYDFAEHVAIGEALSARDRLAKTFMSIAPGSPAPDVWHDVVRMRTLNAEQAAKGREKHICPLQFDVVDRLIERYSMRGETVYDPFGGLFTVPFRAIGLGRKGRAVELNAGYFADGVRHLQAKERELAVPTLLQLFDAMRDEGPSARAPVATSYGPPADFSRGVGAGTLADLKALLDAMSPEELRRDWWGYDDGGLYTDDGPLATPEGRAAA